MSQRLKRNALILGTCAGLIAGCAQGDESDGYAADDYEALAQHTGHDAGAHAQAHDGGASMDHSDAGHAGHDAGPAGHDASVAHAGPDAADPMHHGEEPCRETHPLYRAGLTQKAGDFTIQLVSATPAPPRQQVPNDWTIKILDAAGQPVVGAMVDNADTFMRVHAHGGAFEPAVEPGVEPGEWKLVDLDFTMRGPWEVSFDLTPAGATRATLVTFNICVE